MKSGLKISINSIDILALLIISNALLNIPYINYLYDLKTLKVAVFGITILGQLLFFFFHKITVRKEHFILLADVLFIFLVTVIYSGSLTQFVSDTGTAITTCFMVVICRKKQDIKRVINIWCFFLFLLLLIDTATMFIWPDTMYKSTFAHNNWFLGYKTSRLEYTFSLLVLHMYGQLLDSDELPLRSFALALLVSVNALMSRGSGSAIAVIGFSVIMYILFRRKKKTISRIVQDKTRSLVNNHALLLIIWGISFLLFVAFQNQTIFSSVIVSVFNKTYSFNERTNIWESVLATLKDHWFIGVGMQSRGQMMELTDGFANAHNTLFTYLLTGGVVGVSMLIYVFAAALKRTSKCPANYAVTVYFYCMLFLGINSSALAFCPFFFAIMLLPLADYAEKTVPVPSADAKDEEDTEDWSYEDWYEEQKIR